MRQAGVSVAYVAAGGHVVAMTQASFGEISTSGEGHRCRLKEDWPEWGVYCVPTKMDGAYDEISDTDLHGQGRQELVKGRGNKG